jgi:hypothetical protein
MSDKHPYTPSTGHIIQVINHFRQSFPNVVNADTLKKLGFATKNESYIINILRFLGTIDQEGNKSEAASKVFSLHDDSTFSQEFGKMVAKAYNDLFDLHGDKTWGLNTDGLITFFRQTDGTSGLVGKLQASTFQILAAFSGHGEIPEPKASVSKAPSSVARKTFTKSISSKTAKAEEADATPFIVNPTFHTPENNKKDIGLTVRIEINLPSDGDQETYDRIFKSIRDNLIDG